MIFVEMSGSSFRGSFTVFFSLKTGEMAARNLEQQLGEARIETESYGEDIFADDVQNDDQEIWRPIADFPNYEVSSHGRVRNSRKSNSESGGILAQSYDGSGYLKVNLSRNGRARTENVHRLVADAFVGNRGGLGVTDHRDRDRTNNRASNLRFVSRSANGFNRKSHGGRLYEHFNEVPEPFVQVRQFGRWIFDRLYYSSATDKFYFKVDNDIGYRILIPVIQDGLYLLNCYDESGSQRRVNLVKITNCAIRILEAEYITGIDPADED